MAKTIKGRVGWAVAKKLIKAIPFVGPIFSVGFAGYEIKKKGVIPGAIHVGLDVTPVVGTAKNVVEIFTGDWIPDKSDPRKLTKEDYVPPTAVKVTREPGDER